MDSYKLHCAIHRQCVGNAITKYRIEGMKLIELDLYVNKNGELKGRQYFKIRILPLKSCKKINEEITILVKNE